MHKVRCSECGVEILVKTKATAQLSEKVIYIIQPHKCEEFKSLADLGITSDPVPLPITGKFVQKLDELNKPKEVEPGDRRPNDQIKDSIAPRDLLRAVKEGKLGGS